MQGTGQAPGGQQSGAGAHGADQVDGQVTPAVVGQGEAGLRVLQPRDVAGLSQAGGHRLPHLQPLPDVPEQKAPGGSLSQARRGPREPLPPLSEPLPTSPQPSPSPHLGSVRMSIVHLRWGATVVQFWAKATMAPASNRP